MTLAHPTLAHPTALISNLTARSLADEIFLKGGPHCPGVRVSQLTDGRIIVTPTTSPKRLTDGQRAAIDEIRLRDGLPIWGFSFGGGAKKRARGVLADASATVNRTSHALVAVDRAQQFDGQRIADALQHVGGPGAPPVLVARADDRFFVAVAGKKGSLKLSDAQRIAMSEMAQRERIFIREVARNSLSRHLGHLRSTGSTEGLFWRGTPLAVVRPTPAPGSRPVSPMPAERSTTEAPAAVFGAPPLLAEPQAIAAAQ